MYAADERSRLCPRASRDAFPMARGAPEKVRLNLSRCAEDWRHGMNRLKQNPSDPTAAAKFGAARGVGCFQLNR